MIIVNNLKWNQLYIEGKYTLRRIFVNYGPTPLSFWPSFHISIVKSLKIVMSSKREKHTHTHNENYTRIPKSILNQCVKIYYKKKEL